MKACFSKKLSLLRDAEQLVYTIFKRCELNGTCLNKKHEGSVFALGKDFLIVLITGGRSAVFDLYEKTVGLYLIRHGC